MKSHSFGVFCIYCTIGNRLHWVELPDGTTPPSGAQWYTSVAGNRMYYPVRGHLADGSIIPGFLWNYNGAAYVYIVDPSTEVILNPVPKPVEYLVINKGYKATWVEYTVGEAIPKNAVVAGNTSDGSPAYLAQMEMSGYHQQGHYDPNKAYALIANAVIAKPTTFKILLFVNGM